MRNVFSLLLSLCTLFTFTSCENSPDDSPKQSSDSTTHESTPSNATRWEIREELAKHFTAAGVTGSFLLYDPQKDLYIAYDTARCAKRFCPASTFKIFNSLLFLETGVIRDENEVIRWDSVKRHYDDWNRDHTLRSAMQYSVVWFHRELARRAGREAAQKYLDSVGYGNHQIGDSADMYWLDNSLLISPIEQIGFLQRLHAGALPFSKRSMDIVKDIMILKKTDAYIYRGKTGQGPGNTDSANVGWFVGYLERGDDVYFFATNIDIEKDEDAVARKEVSWNILRDMKLVEE